MAKTENLGLELTEDSNILFQKWREAVNGNGEGEGKSNAQLIDEFAGKFLGGEEEAYLAKSSKDKFAMKWETPDTTPTKDSKKLLSSGAAHTAISAADTGKRIDIATSGAVSQRIEPDKFYSFTGNLSALNISFSDAVEGRENEYKGQFLTRATAPTVEFPQSVVWLGGMPIIEPNKKYQFSVLDNVGIIVGSEVSDE